MHVREGFRACGRAACRAAANPGGMLSPPKSRIIRSARRSLKAARLTKRLLLAIGINRGLLIDVTDYYALLEGYTHERAIAARAALGTTPVARANPTDRRSRRPDSGRGHRG